MKSIISIVETTLSNQAHSRKYGLEYSGPCPWCGGKDRFHVFPNGGNVIPGVGNIGRFDCMDGSQGRAGCGRSGNIIDYVQLRRNCSFEDACEEVEIDPQAIRMYRLNEKVKKVEAEGLSLEEACKRIGAALSIIEDYRVNNVVPDIGPRGYSYERALAERSEIWRTQALGLARWASSQLAGEALAYLHQRGMTNRTIRAHLLGFYPTYKRVKAELWGYEYTEEDRKQKRPRKREIWIPRGIVLPWFDDHNQVVCLRFRRLPDDESDDAKLFYGVDEHTGEINRYKAMYGSSAQYLYRGELLTPGCDAALFEGEIDALITSQEVVDAACTCVATGSTGWGRSDRFVRRLAACDQVLVCFNADENLAGDKAAQYWLNTLHNARRWRPLWSDANDMARDGIDLLEWLTLGLEREVETAPPIEIYLCSTCLDAGIERTALSDDYEGTMYCAEHHPAHQTTILSDQEQESPILDRDEIIKRFVAAIPGGCTVTTVPPGYTIQDRARELAEARKVQNDDYWAWIESRVLRPPVGFDGKPYYTPEVWAKKYQELLSKQPDPELVAHLPFTDLRH